VGNFYKIKIPGLSQPFWGQWEVIQFYRVRWN